MRKNWFIILLAFQLFPGTGIAEEYARGLQPGEGRDLVLETCTGCHSAAIILQNHLSRKRWDETITWMQEKQGLQKLNPQTRSRILNYLEKTQSPRETSKGKKSARKTYQYDYQPNPL